VPRVRGFSKRSISSQSSYAICTAIGRLLSSVTIFFLMARTTLFLSILASSTPVAAKGCAFRHRDYLGGAQVPLCKGDRVAGPAGYFAPELQHSLGTGIGMAFFNQQ